MNILFFGDSLVLGVADPEYLGWPGRLCAASATGATMYNLGIRKLSSRALLSSCGGELERRHMAEAPTLSVFSFGAVDMAAPAGAPNVPLEESVSNARTLLKTAAEKGKVLFVGPPPVKNPDHSGRISELSAAYARLCEDMNVPYLDLVAPLGESEAHRQDLEQGDGVHPMAAGYAEAARLVGEWDAWKAAVGG